MLSSYKIDYVCLYGLYVFRFIGCAVSLCFLGMDFPLMLNILKALQYLKHRRYRFTDCKLNATEMVLLPF